MAKKQQEKITVTETKGSLLDSIFDRMESEYHIPKSKIPGTLRETAFKEKDNRTASESEMISLLSVAEKYKLNPFIREIYAFRNKNGVLVPIVGVDGWIKIMNTQPSFDGYKFQYSENMTTVGKSKECFEWIEITIYIKERQHPVIIREYLDECYNGGKFSNDPWDTHTKRFLRHKTISQGVRYAFGVNDIYDADEAERIDTGITGEQGPALSEPETAEELPTKTEEVKEAPQEEPQEVKPDDIVKQARKNAAATGEPAKRKPEALAQTEIVSTGEEPQEETPPPPQSEKKEIPDFF